MIPSVSRIFQEMEILKRYTIKTLSRETRERNIDSNLRGALAPLEPPKIINFGRRNPTRDDYVKITNELV